MVKRSSRAGTFVTEILGWYGAVAILAAYALVTANGTGAACLLCETVSKKDVQPALLNGVWTLIAVLAIIRLPI